MPTWFITGCSTGFGRAIATAVLERGWNCVVTARDPATVADFAAAHPDRALALPLDVTDRAQIAAAVVRATERFGAIDVLVNNAGYGYRAAVEEGDEAEVAAMFDVNLWGLVAVTKAVLPLMRARRSGTIVMISSVSGRLAFPGSGYYAASKFAVAGLSDALRHEVAPLGMRVIVVEPSGFRTDFIGRSLRQGAAMIPDYAETTATRRKENDRTHGRQAGDPARAAAAIIGAVESPRPPAHLPLGRDAVTRIRGELEANRAELEEWAAVGEGADFRVEG